MNDWIYILKDNDEHTTTWPTMPSPQPVFRVPIVRSNWAVSEETQTLPDSVRSNSVDFELAEANRRFKTAFYVRAD